MGGSCRRIWTLDLNLEHTEPFFSCRDFIHETGFWMATLINISMEAEWKEEEKNNSNTACRGLMHTCRIISPMQASDRSCVMLLRGLQMCPCLSV